MSEQLFERILAFIVQRIGVDELEVTRDALLQDDLGIYGDDATEFFIAFAKEFHVDVSNFMAADYFRGEGLDLFGFRPSKKSFTVAHLEKAVIAGRLDEDVINS